ncbi:MAG: hypothetical protein AAF449_22780 [Myxococcota bacterium]
MPKLDCGRLDGLDGMAGFTAEELYDRAKELEAKASDPASQDDPRYLKRWAAKVRNLAERKEKSLEHKTGQRKAR